MANKVKYLTQLQEVAGWLAAAMDDAPDLVQRYFDNGYGASGADEITDADCVTLGLTAANITSLITTLQNFDKFCNADNPLNDAYRVTINQVRP